MNSIADRLFALQDMAYKAFHSRLIPTVNPDCLIGVRVPQIRTLAKELRREHHHEEFMQTLPHCYYDEYLLHAILLSNEPDFSLALEGTEKLLPYIDNWAVCDSLSPKCFKKHRQELMNSIDRWISADDEFTIRFGIKMMMEHYLDEDFRIECLEKVSSVRNDAFYVRMMIAWFFASALAKQYEHAIVTIESHRLARWTHNKTIQKAIESFRVSDAHKAVLRTLRI